MAQRAVVLMEGEPGGAPHAARVYMRQPTRPELYRRTDFPPILPEEETFSQPGPNEQDPLPEALIQRYALMAIARATAEQMPDGTWYVEVASLPGVWAEGDSVLDAAQALQEVIREWVVLKIRDHDRDIPIIGGIDLNRI